ncbi:HAMP domain-containing histidine kinase [Aliiglaciecola sp.]|nr:HAMP domain-containing histidine kinase [Aliiglaciecola sp.]
MSLKNKNQLLEHEIDKRSNELIQAETQLIESKKNASLTSLVVGVAHEINTPIGIAVTASSMIQHDALKLIDKFNQNKITRTEFEKALNNIIQSSGLIATNLEKSTHLIQSFKNLSTDQISQAERHINLKKYLQEVFINLGPTIDRAGIEWSLRCDDDIELTTYPGAISQLVTQLALNAIDHAFEGIQTPKLMITAERRDDYIQLRFEDNGVGVTDELKKKIFNPFFTTRRQHGNIGLGLQIVANIVTIRLRGKINIEDNQPQGTAFVCQFLPEGKAVTTELKN